MFGFKGSKFNSCKHFNKHVTLLLCLTVYCGDILFCWRSVFIQATTECYIPLESVWRGDLKKCRSVRLSVCNGNKKAYSSIIDSRKIIRISDERVWHPLQENEAIFSKKIIFKKFRANFRKILHLLKMPTPPL